MISLVKDLFRKSEPKVASNKNNYLAFFDPDNLSPRTRDWMMKHAGETVRMPLIINADGTYAIRLPVTEEID